MKTYQQINPITEFTKKALEIANKYIEHNKTNPTEKEFDYYNEFLLDTLEKCYKSTQK
jgi:hypothetical protein